MKSSLRFYKKAIYFNDDKVFEFKWSSFKKSLNRIILILISFMVIVGLVLGTVMMTLPPSSNSSSTINLFGQ